MLDSGGITCASSTGVSSLCELETQLLVAKKLDFINDEKLFLELSTQIIEESKMINSFLNKLELSKQ